MTKHEAGEIVSYLNAIFHRESLEPATFAVWVTEVGRLKNAETATATAQHLARHSDRFPTLHQFREDYLTRRGRESDRVRQIESITSGPRDLPPEAIELFERLGIRKTLNDMPD